MRARPALDGADSCAIESSFLRSFQRQRMCCDWSLGAANLRVAVCPFGDELASW